MCTSIQVKNDHIYLGRTMDFSYVLDPEIYVIYKGYEWSNILQTHMIKTQYTFMGVGQDISPITFADGVNEKGFGIAVLYFPGYADFDSPDDMNHQQIPIAATELTQLLLGNCASVEEVSHILQDVQLIGVEDSLTHSVAPLHWIASDRSGQCIVIEKTSQGLQIMNNPIGVLANSPDFTWHLTNLRNYMNVQPQQTEEVMWGDLKLAPFGQGAGTFGLPGDFTPPSRFVRAAYLKSHTLFPNNQEETINACFHILESVSIPKGVVITQRGVSDYTQYTVFIDLMTCEYFYKTYDDSQMIRVGIPKQLNQQVISLGKINKKKQ